MTYREAWTLPVAVRKWWMGRTNKQLKDEADAAEKAAKNNKR